MDFPHSLADDSGDCLGKRGLLQRTYGALLLIMIVYCTAASMKAMKNM